MGKIFAQIDHRNSEFIRNQRMFFVASAPLSADGFVNLSPKGLDSFAILDPTTVAYLDLTGSGIETVAHMRENGRITFLFCAFDGPPRLLRLHGRGEAIEPGDPEWDALFSHFPEYPNARSIIRARLDRIADSCGYGVPQYTFEGQRTQLQEWAERKGETAIREYKAANNATSLDGLAGLRRS
ncbi:MAG: pyridoxamine 5'-phosphate oxidase family protein [Myxococcota bacterium]